MRERQSKSNVPGGTSQKTVDQSSIQGRALQLLYKRGLVKRNTGWKCFRYNTFTLSDQFGGEPMSYS